MNAVAPARGSTARRLAAAARVVSRVADERRPLDEALQSESHDIQAADRPAVQALAYGTIRWWPRLERYMSLLLERPAALAPQVRALLAVGLHQLEQSSHPVHAIVDETVEAARVLRAPRATAVLNAVLRRFLRERAALLERAARDPVAEFSHPLWLIDALRADWPAQWRETLAANNLQPPMWLRVNRRKVTAAAYIESLADAGIQAARSEHAPEAVLLAAPRDVEQVPGFAQGLVSVQDCAAQLTAPLLDVRDGMRVLDACAAPGGKACQILEHAAVELLALDASAARLEQVRENLERLQLDAALVAGDATAPAQWWDGKPFDRILIDAPCSASGVIRRHPDIKLLRRPADIEVLARQQGELLRASWPLLAPGGRLLYATCSTLRAENHAVIERFLAQTPDARALPLAAPGHAGADAPGLQILPGEAGMDGFYYACLEQRRT